MKRRNLDLKLITEYLFTEDTNVKRMINNKIQDDEKSRSNFDAYIEVWEKSADLKELDTIDTAGDWQKVRSRMHLTVSRKRIPPKRYLLRIAAILILALGLTYILSRYVNKAANEQNYYFETLALNEEKSVELSDGSTIHLNKNSKIIRNGDFGVKNRDIILEGEAFFEVTRNADIPFRVHTLNSVIEVLGTSFDIRTDSNLVIVGVLTGQVAFYESKDTQNRLELFPQHTGIFNASTRSLKAENSFDPNSIAWHTGLYIFRNKPLHEAFESVANTFNLRLKIEPDVILNDSSKVDVKGRSLKEIVDGLNMALTLNYIEVEATSDQLIIRRP